MRAEGGNAYNGGYGGHGGTDHRRRRVRRAHHGDVQTHGGYTGERTGRRRRSGRVSPPSATSPSAARSTRAARTPTARPIRRAPAATPATSCCGPAPGTLSLDGGAYAERRPRRRQPDERPARRRRRPRRPDRRRRPRARPDHRDLVRRRGRRQLRRRPGPRRAGRPDLRLDRRAAVRRPEGRRQRRRRRQPDRSGGRAALRQLAGRPCRRLGGALSFTSRSPDAQGYRRPAQRERRRAADRPPDARDERTAAERPDLRPGDVHGRRRSTAPSAGRPIPRRRSRTPAPPSASQGCQHAPAADRRARPPAVAQAAAARGVANLDSRSRRAGSARSRPASIPGVTTGTPRAASTGTSQREAAARCSQAHDDSSRVPGGSRCACTSRRPPATPGATSCASSRPSPNGKRHTTTNADAGDQPDEDPRRSSRARGVLARRRALARGRARVGAVRHVGVYQDNPARGLARAAEEHRPRRHARSRPTSPPASRCRRS